MNQAELKKIQQDMDEREIRTLDIFVAASCIVLTLLWVWFLFEMLS